MGVTGTYMYQIVEDAKAADRVNNLPTPCGPAQLWQGRFSSAESHRLHFSTPTTHTQTHTHTWAFIYSLGVYPILNQYQYNYVLNPPFNIIFNQWRPVYVLKKELSIHNVTPNITSSLTFYQLTNLILYLPISVLTYNIWTVCFPHTLAGIGAYERLRLHHTVILHHQLFASCGALSFGSSLPPAAFPGAFTAWCCSGVSALCLLFACPKVMDEPAAEQTYIVRPFSLAKAPLWQRNLCSCRVISTGEEKKSWQGEVSVACMTSFCPSCETCKWLTTVKKTHAVLKCRGY